LDDGPTAPQARLVELTIFHYDKMMPLCRRQLLWLVDMLIGNNAEGVEEVVEALIRAAPGGSLHGDTLWLVEKLL
jgi:hypothetical protein